MKKVLAMVLLFVASFLLLATAPPGNNGTVFINGTNLDGHEQPHVDCVADIEARGFDPNQKLDWSFSWQSPTHGGTLPHGTITANAKGYGKETVDLGSYLVGVTPHPIQGYHIQLDVDTHAPGGQKHKEFWAKCKLPAPTPSLTPFPRPPTPTPSLTATKAPDPIKTPTAINTLPPDPTATNQSRENPTNPPQAEATNTTVVVYAIPSGTPVTAATKVPTGGGPGVGAAIALTAIIMMIAALWQVLKRARRVT